MDSSTKLSTGAVVGISVGAGVGVVRTCAHSTNPVRTTADQDFADLSMKSGLKSCLVLEIMS